MVVPVIVSETPAVEEPKKKVTKKKAAEVAVVEAPKPKAAAKSVGGFEFKPVPVPVVVPIVVEVAEAEPEEFVEEEAAEEKDDDDEGSVECDDFIHEGVEYTRDENGIVYDIETAEPIGKWTGTGIELFPVDEDEEDDE